jgi:NAD+ diphosphatase
MSSPRLPRFCQDCATPLASIELMEDGGPKVRLRCPACGHTHWNNPTPVLAAIVEYGGRVLLARNAAWQHETFALITGFMEAGESPEDGIAREVKEETNLDISAIDLVGVYDFQRMNQVLIAYHVVAHGEVRLSPELVDYRLYDLDKLKCWPAGTGYALAAWLRGRGHEPEFVERPRPATSPAEAVTNPPIPSGRISAT